MALADAGTFEYWLGDRQLWTVVAPQTGSTGEFDDNDWVVERMPYDEYAAGGAGPTPPTVGRWRIPWLIARGIL